MTTRAEKVGCLWLILAIMTLVGLVVDSVLLYRIIAIGFLVLTLLVALKD